MSVRGQVVAHLVNKVLNVSQYFWWGTQTNRDFNMLAALKFMTMNFENFSTLNGIFGILEKNSVILLQNADLSFGYRSCSSSV